MKWFPTLRKIYDDIVLSSYVRTGNLFIQGIRVFRGKHYLYLKTLNGSHGFLLETPLDHLQNLIDEARQKMAQLTPTTNHDRLPEPVGTTGTRPGWSPELKSRVKARKALNKKFKSEGGPT